MINIETHDSSHTNVDAVRSGIDFLRTHISPMEGDRRLATRFSKNAGMIERRGYTFATLTGAGQNADLAGIAVGMLPTEWRLKIYEDRCGTEQISGRQGLGI